MSENTFPPYENAAFKAVCLDPAKPIASVDELPSLLLETEDGQPPLAVKLTVFPEGLAAQDEAHKRESLIDVFLNHVAESVTGFEVSLNGEDAVCNAITGVNKNRNVDSGHQDRLGGIRNAIAVSIRMGNALNFTVNCYRENASYTGLRDAQLYGELRLVGQKLILMAALDNYEGATSPEMVFDLDKFSIEIGDAMYKVFGEYFKRSAFEVDLFEPMTRQEAVEKVFGSRDDKRKAREERDRVANLAEKGNGDAI
jgi:hypothetical protein